MEPLTDLNNMENAAQCLKTVAHPCRLRMIEMLLVRERTVGELADRCEIQSHVASEHLRLMKDRGLLDSRRDGRKVFYRIAEPGLEGIMRCIQSRFGSANAGAIGGANDAMESDDSGPGEGSKGGANS